MKRVKVHNDTELELAIKFYQNITPNAINMVGVTSFEDKYYKIGISIGISDEGNSIYAFWSTGDDLKSIYNLMKQRTE